MYRFKIMLITAHGDLSKYFPISHEIQLYCASIYSKQRSIALCWKYFTPRLEIAQRNFDLGKVVHSTRWFEQIVPHKPRNSTMLCFNIFQTKIHSTLLKVFHSVFGNSPKKFWFRKSCPQHKVIWENTSPYATKFNYFMLQYIPNKDP